MSVIRYLHAWTILLPLLASGACKKRQDSSDLLNTSGIPTEMLAFRAIFHGETKSLVASREELDRTFHLPTPNLSEPPAVTSADAFLNELGKRYAQARPENVFAMARRLPIDDAALRELKPVTQPVTFILVPGVFGEFIVTKPMSDVFDEKNPSPLAGDLSRALARATDASLKEDERYDLGTFSKTNRPLAEHFGFATHFEGERPLYHLIRLEMARLSLESLGKNEDVATIYVRRLRKLFQLVPPPGPVYLIGYSRGAAVALSMLDKARNDEWFKSVRGMVALGGVIYGSDLADQTTVKDSKLQKQMTIIKELADSLEVPDQVDSSQKVAVYTRNTGRWQVFLTKIVALSFTQIVNTVRDYRGVNLGELSFFIKTIWTDLKLNDFVSDYSNNVRRFKILVDSALAAGDELTTAKRLAWWREHTVPEHLAYHAITATMADPKEAGAMAEGKLSYDSGSVDYRYLLSGYRDYVKATGLRLNDSQVSVHKAQFWPELHPLLNPRQRPFKSTHLALLGTHHWALALRVVNENKDGQQNPFPRAALLKSLAIYLGQ